MTDQWTLNRLNFEGCWQGRASWFGRDADGVLDLTSPMQVIDPTTYAISFSDPDTGVWDGSGLFFAPGGKATYAISRSSYNAGGGCWQFPGAGGQSSLIWDRQGRRFGHEINLFQGRSRSMLVLLWEPDGASWSLQRVGAVAFRCRHAAARDPDRPTCGTPEALLAPLRGWTGTLQSVVPTPGAAGQVTAAQPVVFAPESFLRHPCSAVFPDGLVASIPERLPEGPFQLEIGALLAPDLFQQISIQVNAAGQLTCWERRRFQPPSA
ncbi:MAG: hypothetical protein ACPHGV_08705 [Synechococcus sp.]